MFAHNQSSASAEKLHALATAREAADHLRRTAGYQDQELRTQFHRLYSRLRTEKGAIALAELGNRLIQHSFQNSLDSAAWAVDFDLHLEESPLPGILERPRKKLAPTENTNASAGDIGAWLESIYGTRPVLVESLEAIPKFLGTTTRARGIVIIRYEPSSWRNIPQRIALHLRSPKPTAIHWMNIVRVEEGVYFFDVQKKRPQSINDTTKEFPHIAEVYLLRTDTVAR